MKTSLQDLIAASSDEVEQVVIAAVSKWKKSAIHSAKLEEIEEACSNWGMFQKLSSWPVIAKNDDDALESELDFLFNYLVPKHNSNNYIPTLIRFTVTIEVTGTSHCDSRSKYRDEQEWVHHDSTEFSSITSLHMGKGTIGTTSTSTEPTKELEQQLQKLLFQDLFGPAVAYVNNHFENNPVPDHSDDDDIDYGDWDSTIVWKRSDTVRLSGLWWLGSVDAQSEIHDNKPLRDALVAYQQIIPCFSRESLSSASSTSSTSSTPVSRNDGDCEDSVEDEK